MFGPAANRLLAQTEKLLDLFDGVGRFDLYVLDRRLPDATGLELCERLQEISPGVPCIFYSGDAYELHRREAFAAGAAAYVAKPDIDGLIDAVQKLLAESNCAATTK